MKTKWDKIIHAMVLIKIGQDLGTHCHLTQTIHDVIEVIASFFTAFLKL